jgi:hypothetical protein
MKKIKNILFLIIKIKQLLFIFSSFYNFNEIFDTMLNQTEDNNNNNNNNNNNRLITIIQLTYPLRKIFYGLIILTLLNVYFNDIVDKDTALTIVIIIDTIDKSIVESLNEAEIENSNN